MARAGEVSQGVLDCGWRAVLHDVPAWRGAPANFAVNSGTVAVLLGDVAYVCCGVAGVQHVGASSVCGTIISKRIGGWESGQPPWRMC